MDFSLPTDEEDFAEIRYEWATELVSKEYMRPGFGRKGVDAGNWGGDLKYEI